MNITMLQSVSSLAGSFSCKKSYEVADNLAIQWIAAGYAKATVSESPATLAELAADPATSDEPFDEDSALPSPVLEPVPVKTNTVKAVTSRSKNKSAKSDLL